MTIAQTLKQSRKVLKLTQMELASRTGISLATIQNLEAGRGNPELSTLETLAESLGLEVALHQKQIDWPSLASLGVPILVDQNTHLFQPNAEQLRRALRQLSSQLKLILLHSRESDAVAAFCWALESHYPTIWREFAEAWSAWLTKHGRSSRLLHLRRMALERLGAYL